MKIKALKKLWNLVVAFISISTMVLLIGNVSALTVLELKDIINAPEFEFENIPELAISKTKIHPNFFPYFKFNNVSMVDYNKKEYLSLDPRVPMYYGPFEKLSQTHRAKITFNICYEKCTSAGLNPFSQDIEFFIELLKRIHDIEFKDVRSQELNKHQIYFNLTECRVEGWYFEKSIPKSWYDLKYNLIIYLIEKRTLSKNKPKQDYELLCKMIDKFGVYSFIHEEFLKRI